MQFTVPERLALSCSPDQQEAFSHTVFSTASHDFRIPSLTIPSNLHHPQIELHAPNAYSKYYLGGNLSLSKYPTCNVQMLPFP